MFGFSCNLVPMCLFYEIKENRNIINMCLRVQLAVSFKLPICTGQNFCPSIKS